jgi:MFS family permease
MLDMAGSAAGALLAFIFIASGIGFSSAFVWSIIPAIIGIIIIFFVKEKKNVASSGTKLSLKGLKLSGKLKSYLAVIFLFCLGNSSNAFLLLKAQEGGFTAAQVILLYLIFNVSASALSIPCGRLSDRCGRRRALVPGYALYGLVYLGFALFIDKTALIILFVVYGAYTALISGAERAFLAESAQPEFRGTVLGLYGMLQGIGLLLSSIIAGLLWDRISSAAPFWFGGIIGLASAAAIMIILGNRKRQESAAA